MESGRPILALPRHADRNIAIDARCFPHYRPWRRQADPPIPADVSSHTHRVDRMKYPTWHFECAHKVQRLQAHMGLRVTPPCNWCGYPGDYDCERCRVKCAQALKAPHVLCLSCSLHIRRCRLCRLELFEEWYRNGRIRQTHALAMSTNTPAVTFACAHCRRENSRKICSGCMCVRYCSEICSRADWKRHKPLCYVLRAPQPLLIVDEDHFDHAWFLVNYMRYYYPFDLHNYDRLLPAVAPRMALGT